MNAQEPAFRMGYWFGRALGMAVMALALSTVAVLGYAWLRFLAEWAL